MKQQLLAAALAIAGFSSVQAANSPAMPAYGSWQRTTAEPAQPLTREQVVQELARARAAGWQGYGSEETLDPQPRPTGVLSRAEVMAEYREWRDAGALAQEGEAGPSQATLDRRVALNNRQVERYARAIEAEQQRLAQIEAQRRAAELAAAQPSTAAPPPAPEGSATTSAAPSATTSGETSATLGSGTATPAPMGPQPAPPDRELPAAPPRSDAAVDTTRPRSDDVTAPPPDQAQPQPVR